MTTRLPPSVPRHFRGTPGTDVALCGERGSQLTFALTQRYVTCETCRVKRASPEVFERAKSEFAARRKHFKKTRTQNITVHD